MEIMWSLLTPKFLLDSTKLCWDVLFSTAIYGTKQKQLCFYEALFLTNSNIYIQVGEIE